MISYNDFYSLLNGKLIDAEDTADLDQCFDLVFTWVDAIGITRDTIRHQYAYQIFTNPPSGIDIFFDVISNTPTNVPVQGDIVVWSQQFNGIAGHTGVATGKGDINTFDCFVQNDPVGGRCQTKTYKYDFVLGWLHPKHLPDDCTTQLIAKNKAFDILYNDNENNKHIVSIQMDTIKQLQQSLEECQNKSIGQPGAENSTLSYAVPITVPASENDTLQQAVAEKSPIKPNLFTQAITWILS